MPSPGRACAVVKPAQQSELLLSVLSAWESLPMAVLATVWASHAAAHGHSSGCCMLRCCVTKGHHPPPALFPPRFPPRFKPTAPEPRACLLLVCCRLRSLYAQMHVAAVLPPAPGCAREVAASAAGADV
jgi:hypothetical protein